MSEAASWQPPKMSGPLVTFRGRMPSAGELELEAKAAAEAGFRRGHAEGLAAAAAEINQRQRLLDERIATIGRLVGEMSKPLARLDEAALQQLTRMAIKVGGELARRELAVDPAAMIDVVRHCMSELPAARREIHLYVDPRDARSLRAALNPQMGEDRWQIVEDASVGRGGCRVVVEDSSIDCRLDERIGLIVEQILGPTPVVASGDITAQIAREEGRAP